ncbi:MAG TPA: hypothetical protein PLP21_18275 [Pyrinomonadaceae bacterium]|nr:hypothetical protein [Pyrinomonadaceae bacterium]
MNNDYLWDKSGDDAEIKGLENLLSGLKYQPTAPPVLPVSIELKAVKAPWWKLSLAFAVPACVLIAVFAGVWMTRQPPQFQAVREIKEIQTPAETQVPVTETKSTEAEIEKDVSPKMVTTLFKPEPKKKSTAYAVQAKYRKRQPKFDTLTSEERFAYNQLMLALSITGSKLKVVSDTINRAED